MDKAVNNSDEHITRKYQAHENIKTKKVGNFSFNEPMEWWYGKSLVTSKNPSQHKLHIIPGGMES